MDTKKYISATPQNDNAGDLLGSGGNKLNRLPRSLSFVICVLLLSVSPIVFAGPAEIHFYTPADDPWWGTEPDVITFPYEADWQFDKLGYVRVHEVPADNYLGICIKTKSKQAPYQYESTGYGWSGDLRDPNVNHSHDNEAYLNTSTQGVFAITLSGTDHYYCKLCDQHEPKTWGPKSARFIIVEPYNQLMVDDKERSNTTKDSLLAASATVKEPGKKDAPPAGGAFQTITRGSKSWHRYYEFSSFNGSAGDVHQDTNSASGKGKRNNLLIVGSVALNSKMLGALGNPPLGSLIYATKGGTSLLIGSYQDKTAGGLANYRIDFYIPGTNVNGFRNFLANGWAITASAGNCVPYPIVKPDGTFFNRNSKKS